jgi:DNA-binding CsgD family transcriptional regulator
MRGAPDEVLVDRIYEAAVVPELWRDVLVDFGQAAGARHSVLIAQRSGFNRWIGSSPECDELVQIHFGQYPTNERTRRLLALRRAGFVTDADVITEAEMANEPVYRDFWFPRGYGNGVATAIFAPSGDTFIVHAECERSIGPLGRDVVDRLDRLRPHFARAVLFSARLEMERVNAAATALELVGLPAAVLGPSGRMLAANTLLGEMIPDVVQDSAARIAFADVAADALLGTAFARIVADGVAQAVCSIPVRARAGRAPVIFHLVPICGAAHDIFTHAAAILVATPVVPQDVPSADVVQGLFDLTPSEAKLAALIAAGHPPREASLKLGVAEETARTTLKRVLAKTGLHRQADLVGLLRGASLGQPRPAEPHAD